MLKKEEVFVRVSSEKKARKLKKLLEMFNQKTFSPDSIDEALENKWVIEFDTEELLWLNSYDSEDKTKVSLKELRNILAVEHNVAKKELEVGKWYKHQHGGISFFEDRLSGYGIDCIGFYYVGSHTSDINSNFWTEATPQEVEEALIKEAKRRYKVGDKLSMVYDDCSSGDRIFNLNLTHQAGLCDLWIDDYKGYLSCIFKDGKWAEVVKPEKSLEERVKELEDRVKELENR